MTDVSGKADKVASATENNFAALDSNGNLKDSGKKASDFVTDVSGKADKVTGGTENDFAGLDSNGNLKDSGKKASDFAEAAAGLPTGGSAGYYLVKTGSGNYVVAWCNPDTVPIPTSPRLITSDAVATVDAKATLALNSIASEYDPTATYKEGNLIFYEISGTTYLMRCKGTTTGSFDPTKWEQKDVGYAIQKVQENVDGLIDDTAGSGDEDVTLSADKIMDELGDRDTDIGNVAAGLAIVVTGDTAPANIDSGAYIFLKGHSTLATGGYHATAAISSGETISSSNVAADADGIANALNSNLNGIPEIVSNANGTALKFPSGLMICYKGVTKTISMTTQWGNQYEGTVPCGDWPVEFTAIPRAVCNNNNSTGSMLESWTGLSKSSCGTTFFCRPISAASVTMDVTIVGFGRWK